ncbi:hypothetical protein HMPREF9078_02057, partial [Capnocytophaga sp. oral taxon 380 str. F0488]
SPFGGSGAYRISASLYSLFRHIPPSAYGLRPIPSSSFFRLETPFLTFLTLLYYIMNQLFPSLNSSFLTIYTPFLYQSSKIRV